MASRSVPKTISHLKSGGEHSENHKQNNFSRKKYGKRKASKAEHFEKMKWEGSVHVETDGGLRNHKEGYVGGRNYVVKHKGRREEERRVEDDSKALEGSEEVEVNGCGLPTKDGDENSLDFVERNNSPEYELTKTRGMENCAEANTGASKNDYDYPCHRLLSTTNKLSFPQKLFVLLEQEKPDVISWVGPDHAKFMIFDMERFQSCIAPKYFKHTKLSSFQRQLNLYGFRRITKGEFTGAYFHPNFSSDSDFNEINDRIMLKSDPRYMPSSEMSIDKDVLMNRK